MLLFFGEVDKGKAITLAGFICLLALLEILVEIGDDLALVDGRVRDGIVLMGKGMPNFQSASGIRVYCKMNLLEMFWVQQTQRGSEMVNQQVEQFRCLCQ